MAVAWTVFTRVAVADKASVRTASQSPFVPQRLPATWPLQIASAKGSRSQKLPQKSVSEHRLRGKHARANNLGQWGNGHMHAVTRAHAKIQSVANKMRVHAWSQKSVKGGVRRRRSLSCLFFDTLRNLSYGWCLVEKRRLLTRRRRHDGRHCQPQLFVVFKGVAPSRPSLGQAHLAPLAQHMLDALGGRW